MQRRIHLRSKSHNRVADDRGLPNPGRPPATKGRRDPRRVRPWMEQLETREVPNLFDLVGGALKGMFLGAMAELPAAVVAEPLPEFSGGVAVDSTTLAAAFEPTEAPALTPDYHNGLGQTGTLATGPRNLSVRSPRKQRDSASLRVMGPGTCSPRSTRARKGLTPPQAAGARLYSRAAEMVSRPPSGRNWRPPLSRPAPALRSPARFLAPPGLGRRMLSAGRSWRAWGTRLHRLRPEGSAPLPRPDPGG